MLASGDPGFFGIVRALRARGIRPCVIPAVSSVADAFARVGLDWDDKPGVITAACDCPYFDGGGLCKHVWASLLALDENPLHLG